MNPRAPRSSRLILAAALAPLLAGPAHARVPSPAAAASHRNAPASASELTGRLQAAIDATNEDPEVHAAQLRAVLDEVAAVPGVVGRSTKLQSLRIDGLLYLARAKLVLDEAPAAEAAIDEAIRVSGGSIPNIDGFGPSLGELYEERRSAPGLRPIGEVQVSCTGGPCRVFLDGRVIGTGTDVSATGIPLGEHVVRIEPQELDPPEPFEQSRVKLDETAPAAAFMFAVPVPAEAGLDARAPSGAATGSGRKLPRWAGILGMTLGGLAVAGGVFAIAIDGRCPDLSDPSPVTGNACRDVHDSLPTGIGVLAAGVAGLTGFGVAFGLGEAKDKRHSAAPTSAAVQFRFRF